MIDRLVRVIDEFGITKIEKQPFSEFNETSCCVLLGAPGSGKTYLFKHFANINEGRYITARDFLIVPLTTLYRENFLFIDALDEKRSGRGDDSTIDQIASRIAEVTPIHVRLACRAADWLGDSDLSAFKAVYSNQDEIKILALEPLSSDEQYGVLTNLGDTEPKIFLDTACDLGLESMLENPQTLTMLWEQVGTKGWPATRLELFTNSVDLLLSEHNANHKRKNLSTKNFTTADLSEAVGAICALRLISDIRGIALQEISCDDNCPSYCDISLIPQDRLLSVLSSRLFITDEISYISDYLHRTLAEFAGAKWLTEKIRAGLPFGRVIALITHERIPTTELRGLHAWLSVHLQEHAEELIDADPFGVLTYGDPASLSPKARMNLINSLARLAERDPWFRAGHWNTSVSGLGQKELVPQFCDILLNKKNSNSLRSIVFDAIYSGRLGEEMFDTLLTLAQDDELAVIERKDVINALLQCGEFGDKAVLNLFANLSRSNNDFQIRTHVIRLMYGKGIGPESVAELLEDALNIDIELPFGVLWALDKVVPDDDITYILECFNPPDTSLVTDSKDDNHPDVIKIFDMLISRTIVFDPAPSSEIILGWLYKRMRIRRSYYRYDNDCLNVAMNGNQSLLAEITKCYFENCKSTSEHFHVVYEFEKLMDGAVDWSIVLNSTYSSLLATDDETKAFYLEIAFIAAFKVGPSALTQFNLLLELRDEPSLSEIVNQYIVCQVPDWRTRDAEYRKRRNEKDQITQEKNQREFDENLDAILEGVHLGWMRYIGQVYFSLFSDLDAKASPRERLVQVLGDSRGKQALIGIKAFFSGNLCSSVDDILALHGQNKYQKIWYAFIAGLCELHASGHSLDLIDDCKLHAALIIDCLCPVSQKQGNVISDIFHDWKSTLLKHRPSFAAEIYAHLAKHHLVNRKEYVKGLNELLRYEQLAYVRSAFVIELLKQFPVCSTFALEDLVTSAYLNEPTQLKQLIPLGCRASIDAKNWDVWAIWTVFGVLLDVPDCLNDIETSDCVISKKLIWVLRDAFRCYQSSFKRGRESIEEFVIHFVGSKIPNTEHPNGVSMGDMNPWDASEFVTSRINNLAAFTTIEASEALERLVGYASLSSYRRYLLHAIEIQRIKRVDANFKQLNWREVQETLKGGAPANIADLQTLVMMHLKDLNRLIRGANTDPYKQFWNVDSYGGLESPKPEEVCRDALVDMLRPYLRPLGLRVEPEGHMASDKRADICIFANDMKLVIELKRDYHAEVWTAIERQLDRFYTRDPEANGFGVYGVFWFGRKRKQIMPAPPTGCSRPESTDAFEGALINELPDRLRDKIKVFVLDVSGEYD